MDIEKVISLLQKGKTQKEIADSMGISRVALWKKFNTPDWLKAINEKITQAQSISKLLYFSNVATVLNYYATLLNDSNTDTDTMIKVGNILIRSGEKFNNSLGLLSEKEEKEKAKVQIEFVDSQFKNNMKKLSKIELQIMENLDSKMNNLEIKYPRVDKLVNGLNA